MKTINIKFISRIEDQVKFVKIIHPHKLMNNQWILLHDFLCMPFMIFFQIIKICF